MSSPPPPNGYWKSALLTLDSKIVHAINNLEQSALRIILVTDENGVLLGTISDGDIRRALLRGLNLDSPLDSIVNRNAISVPPDMDRDLIRQLMLINKLQQIPIINQNFVPIGLHMWDEIIQHNARKNLMVIMAGGMGIRLKPLTNECPKPMLQIAGKPILEHIIENAKQEGFSNFVLVTHYLGHVIQEYFGNGKNLNIQIDYLTEKIPMGTVGGISLLNPLPETPFLVTNGDVITNIRYGEMLDFHIRQNASATMAVRLHEWQNPFGVVETNDVEIIGFNEKPVIRSQINAGVYVLNPEVINLLDPNTPCHMPDLFENLKQLQKRIIAYPVHEPWIDIGRLDDLNKAIKEKSL